MDWLKQNALTITLGIATIVSTYAINTALYGYRLTAVELRQDRQGTAITALQDSSNDLRVAVAQIQTSLEYIKAKLDKLSP